MVTRPTQKKAVPGITSQALELLMTDSQLVRVGDYKVWMLTSDFQFGKFARGEGAFPELAPLDRVFKHYGGMG